MHGKRGIERTITSESDLDIANSIQTHFFRGIFVQKMMFENLVKRGKSTDKRELERKGEYFGL